MQGGKRMSNFIVLTSQYGNKVVINSNNIIFIDDDEENEKVIGSRLTLLNRNTVWVRERPCEILDKIKENENG